MIVFEPYAEKLLVSGRRNNCPWVLVFNPIAVRFRYRHHECLKKPGHAGFHECPCGTQFDELGLWAEQRSLAGTDYIDLTHVGGGGAA